MGIILHDSYDFDWSEKQLYRELFIATSLSAYEVIRYYRPLHAAVMSYDVEFENSENAVRMVLKVVSSFGAQGRYEKVILVEDMKDRSRSSDNIDSVLRLLNDDFIALPRQRRVFYVVVNSETTDGLELIGQVQAARCLRLQESVWTRPLT